MKTVYIDSNIIIRLIVKDSDVQFRKSQDIVKDIESNKVQGCISILVINEILWILEHYYNLKREVFIPWLLKLILLKKIKIIEMKKSSLVKVLRRMEKFPFDFTDLYLVHIAGVQNIVSFDKDFKKISA